MSENKNTSNNYGDAFNVDTSLGDENEESRFIGDFDAFLKSMGIDPIASTSATDKKASVESEAEAVQTDAETTEPVRTKKKKVTIEDDNVVYAQNEEAILNSSEERQEFLHKFRVLQEDVGNDEPIFEQTRTQNGDGVSFADSLDADEHGDIFDAAEKAGNTSGESGVFSAEGKSVHSMKKKAKKKKKEQLLVNAKSLRKRLIKNLKRQKIQLALLYALSFITLILYILPKLYTKDNPLEFMFSNGALVYGIANLVCLVLSCIVAFDRIAGAFKSFKNMSPNSDTALFIVCLFVLIHNAYTISAGISGFSGGVLFNIYAVLAILVSVISENLKCKMTLRNIALFSKSTSLDTIHTVDDAKDSSLLAAGLAKKGKEKLLYCAKANTIDSLSADMGQRSFDGKFYSIVYMAVLLASVFCGVLSYLRGAELSSFFTAFVSCACLCGPNTCEFSRTMLLYRKNKELNVEGAGVLSFDSVEKIGKSNAVIMDVSDIFTAEVTRFRGVPGARVSRNEAAVLTVSALKGANSLIYPAFADFENSLSELPVAEISDFLPGAGYVSKVLGRQVLIGNRKLLAKYKVLAPSEAEEKAYGKGKSVFYVAVDGIISATFVVDYTLREGIKKASAAFNRTGMLLILTSKEPTLRENMISSKLDIDVSSIKILNKDGAALMSEYRLNRSMRKGSGLVSVAKRKSAFLLASFAHRIFDADRMLLGLNIAMQLIFFMLLISAVFINVSSLLNPMAIIIIHALCAFVCTAISVLKK